MLFRSVEELDYLATVSDLFGISPLTFRRLKATHMGLAADDPYAVLGIDPDAPDEVVRSAWRSALVEVHPDRVLARGLPAEYVEVAHAKAAALNAAFDAVRRERGLLLAGG